MRLANLACGGAFLLCATTAGAQEAKVPSDEGDKAKIRRISSTLADAFTRPVHPVIDTVASGGWLGAGIGYDHPSSGPWSFSSKALMTMRRYWLAELDAAYTDERLEAAAYARARHMNRLNYFGSGPDSDASSRTSFTLRDPVVGAVASFDLTPAVAAGGRLEQIWPVVDDGRHPSFPSIESRFSEADAPGLSRQPRFGRYQAFVQVDAPAASGWGFNQGGSYRISYDVFDDQQLDAFDFHRVQLEARHRIAMPFHYHSLALRGWVSSAQPRAGNQVPFFLQHTLGGTSNIRSVHEAPLGGDGTAATLRGFANHRFRDNHLLLLQAEYRFSPWGPIETTLFFDAGKAVPRRSSLTLSHLQTDYGFSVSLMRAAGTVVRTDFAFGGDEGARIYFSMGGLLP
jgi:hypothetical protein